MKKEFIIKPIILFTIAIISLFLLDYFNVPALLGLKTSNLNLDFYMDLLNILIVILLYIITFKTLDKKALEREKNKNEISMLLLRVCYQECMKYIYWLNQETIEKYIIPKTDFNSTEYNGTICDNIQKSPFINENIIMDLVKDGQIAKCNMEKYFEIKERYMGYISTRITFFDAPQMYEPLKTDLCNIINKELDKISTKI